jgi:hypothetical protein
MSILSLSHATQVVIAVSIVIVWVLRFNNVVAEFKHFGLPDMIRNVVGATKISLATLLVVGIWHPALATIPALLMAGLMVCAQLAHFKVKNSWFKHLPSLLLLGLSLFVAYAHSADAHI